MDTTQILSVCQGFKYEKCEKHNFVFRQGDTSNDKFYIILKGEVAVVNTQRLGDFGESLQCSQPDSAKSPRSMTFITASNAKSSSISSARDLESRRGSAAKAVKSLKNVDLGKFENKRPLQRQGCLESQDGSVNASRQPSAESGKKKIVNKMKAVYDAVKALRTMQRCIPSLKRIGDNGILSLTDLDSRAQGSTLGTLQHLDDVEGENEEDDEEDDKKDFEEYAQNYGKVVQYLGVGESFGEIALKKNQPRTASILCRVDCEFLTLEKQQFDEVFGKIEKEKEEFLVSVFPNLNSFSSANLNFLICCFKVKVFFGKNINLELD